MFSGSPCMHRIIPGIESVKGIPANIEDEHFLKPAIRNLIVIDDLMSETSNDKRICDLFTKGSHHHNLSVICLVQNLYYQEKESRTMSLYSQYLVLFNNPLGPATGLGLGKTDAPRTE